MRDTATAPDRNDPDFELRLTRDLLAAMGAAETLEEVLTTAIELLCARTGWNLGQAWLQEPDGPRLYCIAGGYADSARLEAFREESRRLRLHPGEGLPGHAWVAKEPQWIPDLAEAHNFPRREAAERLGLRCAATVPVLVRTETVAVMEFFALRPQEEDRVFLDVISIVAAQIGFLVRAKQSEEVLRLSEEKFRTVTDSASDAIVSANSRGRIVYANRSTEQLFGRTREELIGAPLTMLMPERYRAGHLRGFERFFATGESKIVGRTLELTGLRSSEEEFPIELSLSSWSIVGETFATGIIRDSTDRKAIEAELAASEMRLAEAQRVSQFGSWEVDLRSDGIAWSEELYRIVDRDPATFVPTYTSCLECVHPDDRSAARKESIEQLESGSSFSLIYRLLRPDGSVRVAETRGGVMHDGQGQPVRAVGTVVDVTDRMDAQLELDRLYQQNELILRSTGEGLFGTDLYGRLIFANPAGAEMLGFDPESVLGESVHQLIHHSTPGGSPYPVELCPIVRAVRNGEVHGPVEDVFWRSDGTSLPVEVMTTPIWENGRLVGGVMTFRDITDRLRADEEREALKERVRHSERLDSVGQLAGGIAHDFNNLLSVIINYSAFVATELDEDKPLREDVEEIRRAAERAAELTQQLLTFSRHDLVRPQAVDLNDVVRDVERLLIRTLGEHVDLQTSLDPEVQCVSADPGQLEQVLLNLAVNARDAMPQGGTLRIETAGMEIETGPAPGELAPGPYTCLRVSDTGEGMSPQVAARAFEPLYTTKPKRGGTGLGLATVYGIVTRAGGRVTIDSSPDQGTVFTIHLPASTDSPEAPPAPRPSAPAHGQGETILLVDDESAIRTLTRRILLRDGYSVVSAGGASEALAALKARDVPVDLLLTDIVMPGMSGPELAGHLRRLQHGIRVVFMSGYAEGTAPGEINGTGISLQQHALLAKPFRAEELLREVRGALDRPPVP